VATEHGHASLVVVDDAKRACEYSQRKMRQRRDVINVLVELTAVDNHHRHQLPSSFFCVLRSTHRSCHTYKRTGTPHVEFPCCHFENGKAASIRLRRPKR